LSQYAEILRRYELASTNHLSELPDGQATRLGGIISKLQPKLTKAGKPMAILTIEDLDGPVEVLVFPEAYAKCSGHLKADTAVFVTGTVSLREDKPKLFAENIIPLADVPTQFTKAVHIRLPVANAKEALLEQVRDVLRAHKGSVPVMFCFMYPDRALVFVEAHETFAVAPTEKFVQDVEALVGEDSVWLKVNTEKLTTATNVRTVRPWERKPNAPQKAITWDSNRPDKA
jgi:DNA polymerase III subunit alpha